MARMIGLSRPLKLEWLNKTVELVLEGKTEYEIKEELDKYLSFEIKSPTNLCKTRGILMKIWVKTPDKLQKIRKLALDIFRRENSNKLVIHWCMILLTYPIFSDTCALIGKIADIQGTFTAAWLKQNLFDIWGERSTLLYSAEKILQTLKYMGTIKNIKPGEYEIETYEIKDRDLKYLIALTIINMEDKSYYEITELSRISQMFPFKYTISHELLYNSDLFSLNNFGGKVTITANLA